MRSKVLGLPVDILSKDEVVDLLSKWVSGNSLKLKHVVTAYSEFYVNALRDVEFAEIMRNADLVTADGRSVLAANWYMRRVNSYSFGNRNFFVCFWVGCRAGWKILTNDLGETVTGVWLFEEVCRLAEIKGWRVFVLGGWGDVNLRATRMLLKRFPMLRLASDAGESSVGKVDGENELVVEKINKFKPDVLFVQYKPVQQEKWISGNSKKLKVKVAIGIGGTLDEFVGDLKQAPTWMQAVGLKWLWRLIIQPHRWKRMIDAVIVFPWLVFLESFKKTPKKLSSGF